MKHYSKDNEIYAFAEDGSQDHLITDDMTFISESELAAMREPSLSQMESQCLKEIDEAASSARERFITSGVGQEAVYLTKHEEAVAYDQDSSPSASTYPYLYAEADRRGMTVADLSAEVQARRSEWTDPPGATIEAERVGGKDDVRAASTADNKRAAADAAIATLDAITPA